MKELILAMFIAVVAIACIIIIPPLLVFLAVTGGIWAIIKIYRLNKQGVFDEHLRELDRELRREDEPPGDGTD